jgi:glutamate-ammonia-ligase adenylyltransferase
VRELAALGLLPEAVVAAHDTLARLLVAARLLAPDAQEPSPAAKRVLAKACGCGDWEAVLEALARSRGVIAAAWAEAFGEALEVTP